jgi:anti-sigma regulatory factor (Ser/Thr protein kinase)
MSYDRPIGTRYDLEFEPTHAAASRARRTARDHLDGSSLIAEVVADLELVIAELASNAVEQEPIAPVRLTIVITAAEAIVTVANESTGTMLEHRSAPGDEIGAEGEALAERGWGLGIVQAVVDELWVDNTDGWTSVSCLRRLETPQR